MTDAAHPYQDQGAAFLVGDRPGRRAIFDEPGLGKSRQVIKAMDDIGIRRAIIKAPAGAHKAGVWQGEFRKWSRFDRRVIKARDINDIKLWAAGRADVLLLSYEGATKHGHRLQGDLTELIVNDEGHYLKTPDSGRTLAAYGKDAKGHSGLDRWAVNHWTLTGTPMPNDPIDLWTWLRFVGGTPLNLAPWTATYLKTRQGTFGASTAEVRRERLAELHHCINAFSIRRTWATVGIQLPPIYYTTLSLDGDTSQIRQLLMQYPDLEPMIRRAVEEGGLSLLDAPHIATLRRLVAEAKAAPYIELLDYELRNGLDKVVIMGLHTRALGFICDELAKRGHVGIRIDGTVTSDKRRTDGVHAFQTDPSVRFAACNMIAAGIALTLTASAHIDMFEESWTPATNDQAIKRVRRLTQNRVQHARFISLANSIDQTVTEVNAHKTAVIGSVESGMVAA